MENEIAQLWNLLQWGLGICAGGFFLLAGWIWIILGKVRETMDLGKKIEKVIESNEKIEKALLGSYDNPKGLVHRLEDLKVEHDYLKARIEKISHNG